MRSVLVLLREEFVNLLGLVAGLGPRCLKNQVRVPGKIRIAKHGFGW
jgi:hypothetical protein